MLFVVLHQRSWRGVKVFSFERIEFTRCGDISCFLLLSNQCTFKLILLIPGILVFSNHLLSAWNIVYFKVFMLGCSHPKCSHIQIVVKICRAARQRSTFAKNYVLKWSALNEDRALLEEKLGFHFFFLIYIYWFVRIRTLTATKE